MTSFLIHSYGRKTKPLNLKFLNLLHPDFLNHDHPNYYMPFAAIIFTRNNILQ